MKKTRRHNPVFGRPSLRRKHKIKWVAEFEWKGAHVIHFRDMHPDKQAELRRLYEIK